MKQSRAASKWMTSYSKMLHALLSHLWHKLVLKYIKLLRSKINEEVEKSKDLDNNYSMLYILFKFSDTDILHFNLLKWGFLWWKNLHQSHMFKIERVMKKLPCFLINFGGYKTAVLTSMFSSLQERGKNAHNVSNFFGLYQTQINLRNALYELQLCVGSTDL